MDAGNMLKPMLARGELRMVGATTLDEYRKHIEKDAALERRFQQVTGRRAVGRGDRRDPARAQGPLRGAPQGRDQRLRARRGRHAVRPLHREPVPARTRRSTWSTRPPPAADGDRQQAGRDRRAAARRDRMRWRSWRWSARPTRRRSTGWPSCAARWPTAANELAGADGALGAEKPASTASASSRIAARRSCARGRARPARGRSSPPLPGCSTPTSRRGEGAG